MKSKKGADAIAVLVDRARPFHERAACWQRFNEYGSKDLLAVLSADVFDALMDAVQDFSFDVSAQPLREALDQIKIDPGSDSDAVLLISWLDSIRLKVFNRAPVEFGTLSVAQQWQSVVTTLLGRDTFKTWLVAHKDVCVERLLKPWIPVCAQYSLSYAFSRLASNCRVGEELIKELDAFRDVNLSEFPELTLEDAVDVDKSLSQRVAAFTSAKAHISVAADTSRPKDDREKGWAAAESLKTTFLKLLSHEDLPKYHSVLAQLLYQAFEFFVSDPDEAEDASWARDLLTMQLGAYRKNPYLMLGGYEMGGMSVVRGNTLVAAWNAGEAVKIGELAGGLAEVTDDDAVLNSISTMLLSLPGSDGALKSLRALIMKARKGNNLENFVYTKVAANKNLLSPFVKEICFSGAEFMYLESFVAGVPDLAAFAPYHAEVLEKLRTTMAQNLYQTYLTLFTNLVKFDPSPYLDASALDAMLASLDLVPERDWVDYNVFQILAALMDAGDEYIDVALPRLMDRMDAIMDHPEKFPATAVTHSPSIALPKLKLLASSHPDKVRPYAGRIESLVDAPGFKGSALLPLIKAISQELSGVTLENIMAQFTSGMKKLGVDPNDPFFDEVAKAIETSDGSEKYDVMLSYNWSHQKTVIRIRDSLVARGFKVWLDLEQMSGNVYGKMASAVLNSSVVCCCLTAAYEASGNCKRELGFAADQTRQGKKIVPIRLEQVNFTWSALITAGLLYTEIGNRQLEDDNAWEESMDGLSHEIHAALDVQMEEARAKEAADAAKR
ncbi:hypothetical protein HK101_000876, partial [Irineochytrium annulatum]